MDGVTIDTIEYEARLDDIHIIKAVALRPVSSTVILSAVNKARGKKLPTVSADELDERLDYLYGFGIVEQMSEESLAAYKSGGDWKNIDILKSEDFIDSYVIGDEGVELLAEVYAQQRESRRNNGFAVACALVGAAVGALLTWLLPKLFQIS